jgi:hypothetical protein
MAQRSNAGGGARSKQVVRTSNPKTEPVPRKVSVPAVSQIGSSLGNHATDGRGPMRKQGAAETLIAGKGYATPVGPTVATPGVGGGRTIHHCGSQSQHGPASGQRPSPGRPVDGPTPFKNRQEY